MDGQDLATPSPMMQHTEEGSSRPTLGFPLGTALLLIVIFCLSGMFSCCYHWDKLRSLRGRHRAGSSSTLPDDDPHHHHTISSTPSKPTSKHEDLKKEKDESLPVIMAGDQIPKFMAWPCPCPCPCQSSLSTTEKNMVVEIVITPSITSHPPTPSPPVN